jgi:hypothetical protein
MVASLLKPLTTGIQNERLSFETTFYPFARIWNTVGRFTTQMVRLDFDSTPTFGGTAQIRLLRKGQLIRRLFLVMTMPNIAAPQAAAVEKATSAFVGPIFGWTNSLGHAMVTKATMHIGNTQVETLDSKLLEVLNEYTVPLEKTTTANRLLKRLDNGFTQASFISPATIATVPLPFWFCRGDSACAFPIDAILQDDVRIAITFRSLNGAYYTDSRRVDNTSEEVGTSLWELPHSPFYQADPSGSLVPGLVPSVPVIRIPDATMPSAAALPLGETYMIAEYVYLDQPEANRFRLGDLQIPIVQHYAIQPYPSRGLPKVRIPIAVPNPTKDLFWMVQRASAPSYNAHFLANRDLYGPLGSPGDIWWPDALGLTAQQPGFLQPAFALSDSEPISSAALLYQGSLVRFRTQTPALLRSILPSWEQKKSPWVNRYYYNYPFGLWNGYTAVSRPRGEANLDKVPQIDLLLEFAPNRGSYNSNDVHDYIVYVWAETYNILRVFGGRAGIMFAY